MIQKLEAEAHNHWLSPANLLDLANPLAECSMQSIIYFIANYIKTEPTAIKEYYNLRSKYPVFRKHFFMVAAELTKLYEQQQQKLNLLLAILEDLLQREQFNPQYICLFPESIFTTILKIDKKVFERKWKPTYTKQSISVPRNKLWNDHSRGYAEIMIILVSYLQNQHHKPVDIVWNNILDVVGQCDLDVDRVMDMVLENLCNSNEIDRIIPLVQHFSKDNFIILFCRKLFPDYSWVSNQLDYAFPIEEAMTISIQDLLLIKKYPYNPRYIKIWRLLIISKLFTLNDFLPYLPHLTSQSIFTLEEARVAAASQKILGTMNRCMDENTEQEKKRIYKKDQIVFTGQAFQCCKFALLLELLRCNNFISFKQLYSSIWGAVRIDLIVYVPILKCLCELLEWIIDPLYFKVGMGKFFRNHKKRMLQINFIEGDFCQMSEVNDTLFLMMEEIFYYLDIYVGLSNTLFVKLCRLFKRIVSEPDLQNRNWEKYKQYRLKIGGFIAKYMIGGLAIKKYRCAAADELYSLLREFKQQERFQFYLSFMVDKMLSNPYLSWLFQQSIQNQVKIINKMSTQNQEQSLRRLIKMQGSQCFQSSYQIMKRVVLTIYQKNISIFVECISRSPVLAQDYALFLCIDYITSNENKLISENGVQSDNFRLLMLFTGQLIKRSPSLKFEYLLQLTIHKLAFPQEYNSFDQNMGMLRIVMNLIEIAFPNLQEQQLQHDKFQYLTYGYHLKLELSDQLLKFHKHRYLREELWRQLINRFSQNGTLLFRLISLINRKMKQIVKNQYYNIVMMGKLMDFCAAALSHISTFFTYHISALRQKQNISSVSHQDYGHIFSEIDFLDLVMEHQLPLPYACSLLRAVTKLDLYSQGTVKKTWLKTIAYYLTQFTQLSKKQGYSEPIFSAFIRHEFFFNFWFCSQEHLFLLEKVYQQKSEELRRIIVDKQSKYNRVSQISQQSLQKHILAYTLIEQEKNQLAFHYQRYNFAAKHILLRDYSERTETTTRYLIPVQYNHIKSKSTGHRKNQDSKLKQFTNLFFTHCLLPRILIDASQAFFCSRYFFRMIRQNKMSSSRALLIIFWVIELVISYLRYSTEREASKCLPIFVEDVLRIFKNWDDYKNFEDTLAQQLGVEKFTQKRHQSLKNYLNEFLVRITKQIIEIKEEAYQIKNCLYFLEKVDVLPITYEQGNEFQRYLQKIKDIWQEDDRLQSIKVMSQRFSSVLRKRLKNVPSMKGVFLEREKARPQNFPFKNPIICIDLQAPEQKTYIIQQTSNKMYKLPIKFQTKEQS